MAQPRPGSLTWWEAAAGWSAEVMALHALIAHTAEPGASSEAGAKLVGAYERVASVATLLDSLIDHANDTRADDHSYVGYYGDPATAADRIALVAREALAAVAPLPQAAHHTMTVAGVAAYYLSAPEAAQVRLATRPTRVELRPVITPILLSFHVLRRRNRRLFPPVRPALSYQPA